MEILEIIKKEAKENFVPIIRDKTLDALLQEIEKENPKRVLEIGTATGYSGIAILQQSEVITLTTIEKSEERFSEAKNNFAIAGFDSRVLMRLGDAYDELTLLAQNNEKFDFVFLDGPKGQYIKYLPIIKDLLNDYGTLFADNVSLLGLLEEGAKVTHRNRTMVRNMRMFLENVANDNDFKSQVYNIDDGYLIAKKQKNDRNV